MKLSKPQRPLSRADQIGQISVLRTLKIANKRRDSMVAEPRAASVSDQLSLLNVNTSNSAPRLLPHLSHIAAIMCERRHISRTLMPRQIIEQRSPARMSRRFGLPASLD